MATLQAAALREFLLQAERVKQPLDTPVRLFARALQLPQLDDASGDGDETEEEPFTEAGARSVGVKFLQIHPQGELLLRVWPEQHGAGSRWERRESFAVFLQVVTHLLQLQTEQDAIQAETMALRIVREKSASLEKMLTWSDKPLIEFRALALLGVLAGVSGTAARELVRLFNFQCQAFVKMATRRLKKPEPVVANDDSDDEQQEQREQQEQVKQPPFQLREAYVELVLTLTACPDKSVQRFATKEGGVTVSLFKSLDGDSAELLDKIFARLGELVLHNPMVERKYKLVVFNGTCVHQLLALLHAEMEVADDERERVRDTALGVLHALFFQEGALYVVPASQALRLFLSKSTSSSPVQGDSQPTTSEQAYAVKVIRNAIVTIGVNELLRSSQAQTLVMALLVKYPGLLAEYLGALAVQLEPKPAYRWFCVASLVQKLLSCSLDAVAAGMPSTAATSANVTPSWCSAQTLAARLIAPGNFRKELSRGIQHANNLVIYSSLGVIEATLQRFVRLAPPLSSAAVTTEVQSELRFLLPSPEALVSLLLKLCASEQRSVELIYVRALTVFRLYLECLPQAMREVKVDFTKTLAWRYLDAPVNGDSGSSTPMQSLIVGEMLRFLLAVDASRLRFLFAVGNANGRSKLLQLLLLYVTTSSDAVQDLCDQVLQRSLLASGIFGRETQQKGVQGSGGRAGEEVAFWLASLREGGNDNCATFAERLVQKVMADPFMYVEMGNRAATELSSSSLSPMTVALVAFLHSNGQDVVPTRGPAKLDLSAYRTDTRVVIFSARILLSLLPTSECPSQLAALIANDDVFMDVDSTDKSTEPQDEELSDATKKRKRSVGSEPSGLENDVYTWLKSRCQALVSGVTADSKAAASRKKKPRVSGAKWYRFSDEQALSGALMALPPAEFAASWEEIVANCAEVMESFVPVHHYLSARGDVDVLALLSSSSSKKGKKANKKSAKHGESPSEAFIDTFPAHIALQHVLFHATSEKESVKKQTAAIATVVELTKSRVEEAKLGVAEATRMCEQLLFFFLSSNRTDSKVTQGLCELLQFLLTVVLISPASSQVTSLSLVVARIFRKLRVVVASTAQDSRGSTNLLWQQLAAVELTALRLHLDSQPGSVVTPLFDLSSMLQRLGVPLVAVLTSGIPASVRARLLNRLLNKAITATTKSPRAVLVERVLRSLGECDGRRTQQQYVSFEDYKHSKLLARKLWKLLESQSDSREAAFFASGFAVLTQVGGVEAAVALPAIKKSLVPLVLNSAQTTSDNAAQWCSTDMLRCIMATIRSGSGASEFVIAFEEQLLERLQGEKDERVRCEVAEAVYSVFTRIDNPALRQFTEKLAPGCYERVLLSSEVEREANLALLRHLATDASVLPVPPGAIVKKLAATESNEVLSSTQLLGLLLLMRTSTDISASSATELLAFIVRSGLFALKEEQNEVDETAAKERRRHRQRLFETVALVAQDLIETLKQQDEAEVSNAVKPLLPTFSEACEIVKTSDGNLFVLEAFVNLSTVLLRFAEDSTNAPDYDFGVHMDAIVQHRGFTQSLQAFSKTAARLRLVRVTARLARITGKYTRSLLQSLLSAYSMSLSTFDRSLRVFFDDFDTHGPSGAELSLASMGFRFGASSTVLAPTTASKISKSHHDLVDDSAWLLGGGLEQSRIRATIEYFPLERGVAASNDAALLDLDGELVAEDDESTPDLEGDDEAAAYDPAFLLPMLSHFISSSDLADAAVVQQGLLGVALRATSSSVESTRMYAYGILAHLHESLEASAEASADFKAGRQVHLLLDVFRRGVDTPLQQVPSVLTVFLNDALGVLTRPTHVLYQQVNHFLLARHALDLGDVPMFYSLFNSRAPLTFRQERSWLLHALRRGVRRDEDVALLVRRHVLPMLLSFFSSELADTHTQPLIAQILRSVLQTPAGAVYLVTKAALLEWLATQFLRQGAAAVMGPRGKKVAGAKPTAPMASSALLLPLMELLESALQSTVWDELDAVQQHATALQAANAFAALQTATSRRCSSSDRLVVSKLAVVAALVLRRAGSACLLLALQQALLAVQQDAQLSLELPEDDTEKQQQLRGQVQAARVRALDSAEVVVANLSYWLLQRRHPEAQKRLFPEWALVLRQVAVILASSVYPVGASADSKMSSLLTRQRRAKLALQQLKAVLDKVPTLQNLMFARATTSEARSNSVYALTLL